MPAYIVTVKEGANKEALKEELKAKGGEITQDYTIFNGFAVKFPDDSVITFDSSHPAVESVEEDQVVTTQ